MKKNIPGKLFITGTAEQYPQMLKLISIANYLELTVTETPSMKRISREYIKKEIRSMLKYNAGSPYQPSKPKSLAEKLGLKMPGDNQNYYLITNHFSAELGLTLSEYIKLLLEGIRHPRFQRNPVDSR